MRLYAPSVVITSLLLLTHSLPAQSSIKYNVAVVILDNLVRSSIIKQYNSSIDCAIKDGLNSSIADRIGFRVVNIEKEDFSTKGVLQALCSLDTEISSVAVILPHWNAQYVAIYKYLVSYVSSLGIPLIIWNSHMSRDKVFNNIIHLGPQYSQQAEAIVSLLQYYKWHKFSILTTRCQGYIEYTSAIRRLVRDTVNEKGEQVLEILSSHLITNMDNETVYQNLKDLRHSDTRVILLHMQGHEAVRIIHEAESLGMVDSEYMWIASALTYNISTIQPTMLPLGMIALRYEIDKYVGSVRHSRAALSISDFWREVVTNYIRNEKVNRSRPIRFPCSDSYRRDFWEGGAALYKSMLGYTAGSKDIPDCANDYIVTIPIHIGDDGVNTKSHLQYINLAYATDQKQLNSLGVQKTGKKIWRTIGQWYAPNITVLDDITWPNNSPKPPDGTPARTFLRVVTHEEAPYVKFTDPDPLTGNCDTIGSVKVRLTNITENSCIDTGCRGNSSLFQCATGLCIDLLNKLKEDMMFDYELMQARDNQWGNYVNEEKTQWNGIVKDLMEGVADMSMTSLKIGPERNEAIDFSIPFIETGITIIVLIKKGVISATAFLEPYKYTVWITVCSALSFGIGVTIFIYEWGSPTGLVTLSRKTRKPEPYDLLSWIAILVGAVHLMGVLILCFDYWSPAKRDRYSHWKGERFSLARSLWLIWTVLFGAAVETDNTKGIASRFLVAVWSLFSLVFLASYTANLAAFMITKEEFYQLEGINDMKLKRPMEQKPPFRFATVPDGSTALNLQKNHPDMYEYMKLYNRKNVKLGIEAVKNTELQAFIYDATVLEYEASRDDDCKLTTVGNWYAMTGYGVGFPKGSKWKMKFDIYLTKYISEGEMDRLREFWLTGACKKQALGKGRESSHSLDIINFTSAYILLIVGIVLAVTLALIEHTYFMFCRRKLRKIDKCGCCSLISLSMGESLSFEESVLEVIETARNIQCGNDLCKANQNRLSHELDMAMCRLNMIHASLRKTDNTSDLLSVRRRKPEKIWNKLLTFSDEVTAHDQHMTAHDQEENAKKVDIKALKPDERLEAVESCL